MARAEPAAELKHRSPVDAKGYTMLMNCVLYDPALSDGAKVTYIVLLDFARQDESCFPGQAKLAERRGMTERSIRNHLGEMEKRGLVTIEQRGHMKTNVYWLEDIKNVYVPIQPSDRKNSSGHDRQKISGLDRKNFSSKENAVVTIHRGKNSETLNVREDGGEAQAAERPTPNASGTGMFALREKAVEEIITLTGDEGSRRRFEQLWEIAEGREALDAWKAAHRAVKRRMGATGKEPLERPGAYFDSTCVRELEKRQVFVPTSEEKQGQKDVAEVIRQGLFQDDSILEQAPAPTVIEPPVVTRPVESLETSAPLDEELLQLEREGGAPWEAFQNFVAAEKVRYVAEMGNVSSTSRERLLTAFDRPEKRRSLLRGWKAIGGDRAK